MGIGEVFWNMIRQLYLTGWLEHVLPFLPSRLGEVFMHIIHTGFELRCLHPTTGCDYRNSVWKEFGTDELRGLWEQHVDGGFGRLEIVAESWSEFLVWVHTFMETGGVRDLGIHGALDSTGIAEAHGFHIVPVKSVIHPGSVIGARYVSEHSHVTGARGFSMILILEVLVCPGGSSMRIPWCCTLRMISGLLLLVVVRLRGR